MKCAPFDDINVVGLYHSAEYGKPFENAMGTIIKYVYFAYLSLICCANMNGSDILGKNGTITVQSHFMLSWLMIGLILCIGCICILTEPF